MLVRMHFNFKLSLRRIVVKLAPLLTSFRRTVKLSETLLNIKINVKPLENPVW